MVFEGQSELLLTAAIEDDMADVALRRLSAGLLHRIRGVEVDEAHRSPGVVGIEHREQSSLAAVRLDRLGCVAPFSSKGWCNSGALYGEFRIGRS